MTLTLVATGCGLFHPAGAHARSDIDYTVESGGITRHYLVHEPTATSTVRKRPAVLVFHGGGGSAHAIANLTRFDSVADENGFVAVYPDGFDHSWNDGRGDDTRAGKAGVDDVAFVSTVIDQLVADHAVDPARIYATGISNGGMFSERLGCVLSERLAAIAPVAGPMPIADEAGCRPPFAMPVLEIHGTADPVVSYDGGVVRHTSGRDGGPGTSPVLSVDETQRLWRERNGCDRVTTTPRLRRVFDGTSVTTQTASCPKHTAVELYSISDGGHTWPGGSQYLPASAVGAVSYQFDASQVIWRFFARFHR
jgi:polyhydroxybutyrate depolymerase